MSYYDVSLSVSDRFLSLIFVTIPKVALMNAVNIVFLLFSKAHLMDLAGAAQVFYEANHFGPRQYKLHYVSVNEQITSEQGLHFARLATLDAVKLRKNDMICVVGIDFKSFVQGEADAEIFKAKEWLLSNYQQGVYLASICTGALILAKIGLLNGVQCTVHWKCLDYARHHFPKAKFNDNHLYVFDKGIFTSGGMTCGIDMALALIEKWSNPLISAEIAQEMVINIRRADTQSQKNTFLDFKNHFNPDVYKAQQLIANNLKSSYTLKDVAYDLNLSERQISRLFKSHTGQTIQQYRDKVRLEHGENLLRNTELSVKEVAVKCGFESPRQFSRIWKAKYGMSPVAFKIGGLV